MLSFTLNNFETFALKEAPTIFLLSGEVNLVNLSTMGVIIVSKLDKGGMFSKILQTVCSPIRGILNAAKNFSSPIVLAFEIDLNILVTEVTPQPGNFVRLICLSCKICSKLSKE